MHNCRACANRALGEHFPDALKHLRRWRLALFESTASTLVCSCLDSDLIHQISSGQLPSSSSLRHGVLVLPPLWHPLYKMRLWLGEWTMNSCPLACRPCLFPWFCGLHWPSRARQHPCQHSLLLFIGLAHLSLSSQCVSQRTNDLHRIRVESRCIELTVSFTIF